MTKDAIITLSINEAGTPPQSTYLFTVMVDGDVVASNQSLSPEDSRAVREISRRYNALFEGGCAPKLAAEKMAAIGAELFALWLAGSWEKIGANVKSGSRRLLVLASDLPDVLNLPWELVHPPKGDFLGLNSKFSIRRFPRSGGQIPNFDGDLRPRPLRLLLAVSSPTDLATLDYEREEEYLIKAISGLDVAFDSGDLGSFQDLRDHVEQFQPHVVHLTGHGAVGKKCPWCGRLNGPDEKVCGNCSASLEGVSAQGYFAFEDESGKTDMKSSEELGSLMAVSGVQCVFVSGCETGKAPPTEALGGVCQGLVSEEVPLAIGWAASISDDVANQFARSFYRTLANGRPVDRALIQARQDVWKSCEKRGDPSWTLPVLYSATDQGEIFDLQKPPENPARQIGEQRPLPGMIEGYAEQFVGRRREQQRLLAALRDGSLQTVIIIGLGGSGKSSLATRLAWKLKGDGFTPIAVPSSREKPLTGDLLLRTLGDAFLAADLKEAFHTLSDPQIPADARLRYAVGILNKNRFLLVLDNFESNMDEAKRSILDPKLAEFYEYLLASLTGSSRAIVTSRYLPEVKLPPKVKEEPLGDFGESSFFKFMRRDDLVENRLRSGELSHELMLEVHRLFGGTPRFLDQIRKVLRDIPTDDLEKQLKAVKVPSGLEKGELQKKLDEYCESIFTSRLYGYLSSQSRTALSRAAVYGVAVNLEGIAAVTGEPVESLRGFVREWQNHAFAYPDSERGDELWAVYGLLRNWLLVQLSPKDRKVAHKAAGDFLSDLVQQNRTGELGLFWMDCLLEARSRYLQASDCERAREVTGQISGFLMRIGLYDDIIRLNEELFLCDNNPDQMEWIGNSYLYRGEYEVAREAFEKELKMQQERRDLLGEGRALHNLAVIDFNRCDYEAARQKFEIALKIRQQIGDRKGEAATLHNLASIDFNRCDYEAARQKFEIILMIKQQIGEREGEAATLHNLASIDIERGEYELARQKFEAVLKINQQFRNRTREASTWHELGRIDFNRGEYEAARQKFKAALSISLQIGDRAGWASTLHNLGVIDLERGEYEEARQKFEAALRVSQQIGNSEGEASNWHELGRIALNCGEHDVALQKFEMAFRVSQQIGDRALEASTLRNLAVINQERGEYEVARQRFETALRISQEIGDRIGEAQPFSQLGIMASERSRIKEGLRLIVLSAMILRYFSHADLKHVEPWVNGLASELNYTQEQFNAML